MNAAIHPDEPRVCWACSWPILSDDYLRSGDVLVCGPCDRLEPRPAPPAPPVVPPEPALPPPADAQPEPRPPFPAASSTPSATGETPGEDGSAGDSLHAQPAGVAAFFGQLPGDETDAELLAALESDHSRSRCAVCAANGHRQAPQSAPELSATERGRPLIASERIVSPAGARVIETEYELTPKAREALTVQPPSASQAPAERPSATTVAYGVVRAHDSFQLGVLDAQAYARHLREAAASLELHAAELVGGRWVR